MTKTVRSSPGLRGSETRDQILRAAAENFGRLGFRKTTITDIASDAGIAKGTVYLYFENKTEIFTYLVKQEAREGLRQVRETVAKAQGAAAKLRAFIIARFRYARFAMERHKTSSSLLLEDRPLIQQAIGVFFQDQVDLVREILEQGITDGVMEIPDSTLVAVAIMGTLGSLDEPWLFENYPVDFEKQVDDLVTFFLHGVMRRKDFL